MNRSTVRPAIILFMGRLMRALLTWVMANLLCLMLLSLFDPGGATDPARGGDNLVLDRSLQLLSGNWGEDAQGRRIVDEVTARVGPSLAVVGIPMLLFVLTAGLTGFAFVSAVARRGARWGLRDLLMVGAEVLSLFLMGYFLIVLMFERLHVDGFGPGRLNDSGALIVAFGAVLSGWVVALWWRNLHLLPALTGQAVGAARARGLPERMVCLKHGVVCTLPALRTLALGLISFIFLLSLVLETLLEVPGLGRYLLDAFHAGDVLALHALIVLGVCIHLVGLNLVWFALPHIEAPGAR